MSGLSTDGKQRPQLSTSKIPVAKWNISSGDSSMILGRSQPTLGHDCSTGRDASLRAERLNCVTGHGFRNERELTKRIKTALHSGQWSQSVQQLEDRIDTGTL